MNMCSTTSIYFPGLWCSTRVWLQQSHFHNHSSISDSISQLLRKHSDTPKWLHNAYNVHIKHSTSTSKQPQFPVDKANHHQGDSRPKKALASSQIKCLWRIEVKMFALSSNSFLIVILFCVVCMCIMSLYMLRIGLIDMDIAKTRINTKSKISSHEVLTPLIFLLCISFHMHYRFCAIFLNKRSKNRKECLL